MPRGRHLTTDAVVVLDGEVLLLERATDPERGRWVLPGGYVDAGERARTACAREVREEVGLAVRPVSFVGLFDDPDRDERGNVSAAYLCVPETADPTPRALEEARQVDTFEAEDLPETGFDHADIVRAAVEPTERA